MFLLTFIFTLHIPLKYKCMNGRILQILNLEYLLKLIYYFSSKNLSSSNVITNYYHSITCKRVYL